MTLQPYYEHGGVTIYNGDCLDVLPRLPDNSVDLILTDPPYFKVRATPGTTNGTRPLTFSHGLTACSSSSRAS